MSWQNSYMYVMVNSYSEMITVYSFMQATRTYGMPHPDMHGYKEQHVSSCINVDSNVCWYFHTLSRNQF